MNPGTRTRCALLLAVWACGLFAGAGALRADRWYVHYENAERALQEERWEAAVAELQQALERKGDSGFRVRSYGMKVIDYFPYLQLGIAYHQLGQEPAALAAFDTEERLGVVHKSPAALAELARYRQLARAAQRQPPPAPSRPVEIARDSVEEAKRLESEGKIQEAMEALAPALAVAPQQTEPTELMASLGARAVAEEQRLRPDAPPNRLLQETLRTAAADFAAGRFEAALSAANRALTLERGNSEALILIRQSYEQISRRLLGARPGPVINLPPAIRFADLRQEVEGDRIEVVERAEFRLNGIAIDSSPVTVEIHDDRGRKIPGSSTRQPAGDYSITEFSAQADLRPGTAVWTVAATDGAGLTSRSEYRILYRPLWFRSPWLWSAAAGILGLAAAAALYRRHRRLRRRRERRFNPYIAGGPVFDESLFYGREPLIQRILQTVPNNSLLLHGERRIGKTSLLHQLQRRLEALDDPGCRFVPVYIDLQGVPEEKLFAALADPISELLPSTERIPALARSSYSHHDLVRELHAWLPRLRERAGRPVQLVLLIDEVDELNGYPPRVSQNLRSLFMKRFAQDLTALTAIVAGVRIRREWEQEGSPWYNFFEEIEVEPLSAEEARRLVTEPVRGLFRFEAGVAERIVAQAEGKPFQIQRRCLALVQRLHEEGRRTVTLEDVG